MRLRQLTRREVLGCALLIAGMMGAGPWMGSEARAQESEPELVTVNVFVKDAGDDKPVAFARLTLTYREEGSAIRLKKGKSISLSAKTNLQGRYKFVNIPKGTIRLMVIADNRQTYGQEIEIDQDNQLVEVKLRKPQPLL
jgi:hypothetical protein